MTILSDYELERASLGEGRSKFDKRSLLHHEHIIWLWPWEGKPRRRQKQIWQTPFAPTWPYYLTMSWISVTIMSIGQLDFFKYDHGVFLLVFHSVKFSRQRKNWHFLAPIKKWRGWGYGIGWISLNMTMMTIFRSKFDKHHLLHHDHIIWLWAWKGKPGRTQK